VARPANRQDNRRARAVRVPMLAARVTLAVQALAVAKPRRSARARIDQAALARTIAKGESSAPVIHKSRPHSRENQPRWRPAVRRPVHLQVLSMIPHPPSRAPNGHYNARCAGCRVARLARGRIDWTETSSISHWGRWLPIGRSNYLITSSDGALPSPKIKIPLPNASVKWKNDSRLKRNELNAKNERMPPSRLQKRWWLMAIRITTIRTMTTR